MNTTPTDTPETDAAKFEFCVGYERDGSSRIELFVENDFAQGLERRARARAAEARVKELESKIADVERRNYDTNRRLSDVLAERAALRLRPIAEAGPVPEGMIRLYASRIPLGPPGAEFWSAFSETDEEDTHCVDVWPPSPAEEAQAQP